MRNAGLVESQAGIKIARRDNNDFRHADDTTLIAESKEELKSLLMKVKEECEKADLKLSIQKTKMMASDPITPWKIDEKKKGNYDRLFSWAPESLQIVTADMKLKDGCSLEEMKVWKLLSHVWLFATPWTTQSMEISRPECWSG